MICKLSLNKAVRNHSGLIEQEFIARSCCTFTGGCGRGSACSGSSHSLAVGSCTSSYICMINKDKKNVANFLLALKTSTWKFYRSLELIFHWPKDVT